MCGTHHKIINDNEAIFTVEKLHEIKNAHTLKHMNRDFSDQEEAAAAEKLITAENISIINTCLTINQVGRQPI